MTPRLLHRLIRLGLVEQTVTNGEITVYRLTHFARLMLTRPNTTNKQMEKHMAHWKSMMDRDFLYAFDLQGKDVTLTIDRVTGGELTGQGGKKSKKPLCYFREAKSGKPLALNATNCKTIAGLYGNDTDAWVGKKVTLFPTVTQFGSEQMECIRIRPKVPSGAGKKDATVREPGDDIEEPASVAN